MNVMKEKQLPLVTFKQKKINIVLMDISKLTPEEKAQLKAQLEAELQAEKDAEKQLRETYKTLVDETINQMFPLLEETSKQLAIVKSSVYEAFQSALVIKSEIYGVKEEQRSNTFTNCDANRRITLGQYVTDDYDDTVNEGITKVKNFLAGLAKDAESEMMVKGIIKLLSRDSKGNLKASRIMQLRQMANESGNAEFLDGVKIIESAYRPAVSKFYIKAERKAEQNKWISIPLGMTEAD